MDDFFWLNYCRKSYVLPKPPRCISVDFTPLLLNSVRYIVLFQNFVVLWKIHMSQNISLPADASSQDTSNGTQVAYM